MNNLRITILSFALFLIVATPRAKAQTADEIIAKHLEALGGKEKVLSVKSVYMEGVAVMANGMEIDSKIWRLKDKLYRQEISFGMGNVVIIATPTKGWSSNPRNNNGAFTAMPDEMLKAMQPQLDPSGPFVDYAAKGNKVEALGQDTAAGKACYKLKVTFPSGQEATYYLDTQTYYVVRESRKGGGMMGGGGGGRRDPNAAFNIDFADYQKTPDGYVFPFSIITGGFGAKMNVEKLEVNKPVDNDKLSKPGN